MTRPTIGVDIGGSKVVAGVVDARGAVLARITRRTPHRSTDAGVVEDLLVDCVRDLLTQEAAVDGVEAVGVGAAGFVSADGEQVVFAPHLSWRDEPLRRRLADRLGLPVVVDNDANAAAWAEYSFGAGRGAGDLAVLTLGTGIGGALVWSGRLHRGSGGLAGEAGHQQVVPGGVRCPCGNRGCLEQYASGSALAREGRELIVSGSPHAGALSAACGGDPTRLEGIHVTQAARAGDLAAGELMAEVGGWLGVGLANLAAVLDPEVIVIGGGVSEAGDLLLEPARATLRRQLVGRGHRREIPVLPAALGADAGLVGAAALAAATTGATHDAVR